MASTVTNYQFLDPASKIDQLTFDAYRNNWLKIVGDGDAEFLNACFNFPSVPPAPVTRLPAVSFTVAQLMEVLSAPGITQVKARFVVNPEKTAPNFGIVLFAVDEEGNRQTSYYLSDYKAEASSTPSTPSLPGVVLPGSLRQHWRDNWADTTGFPLSRQMFATSYGPLQGFNFSVGDFLQPLMRIREDVTSVNILLALHTYFGPSPEGEVVTATFGLMVQTPPVSEEQPEDVAYDISQPCPPGH